MWKKCGVAVKGRFWRGQENLLRKIQIFFLVLPDTHVGGIGVDSIPKILRRSYGKIGAERLKKIAGREKWGEIIGGKKKIQVDKKQERDKNGKIYRY